MAALKRPDRRSIEMIVVAMADQHMLDRRQIGKAQAGSARSAHASYRQRLAVPEDGVGENVQTLMLQQKRGVANPRRANLASFRRLTRSPHWNFRNGKSSRILGQDNSGIRVGQAKLPADDSAKVMWGVRMQVPELSAPSSFLHKVPRVLAAPYFPTR
jgi:hypothetical protein